MTRVLEWMYTPAPCTGFGWSRVYHIYDELRIDNAEMLLQMLNRAYREPRSFLFFVLPLWRTSWGCMGSCDETQPGQVDEFIKVIFHIV